MFRLKIGIFCFGIALIVLVYNNKISNKVSAKEFQPVFGVSLPQSINGGKYENDQEKKAEEVYKNIKVFKGLPASKLRDTMFYLRGALGVSCTHCHVNFNDFEKDDKQAKQTARQMIEMVRQLNQQNFNGREVVNCNTCHRGQTKPTAPLSFAPIKEPIVDNGSSETKITPNILTAEQVFELYLEATGGKTVHQKLKNSVMSGFMFSSEGVKAPLKIYKEKPSKYLVSFDLAKWTSFNAFDGTNGWSQDNSGLHDLTGSRLDILRREGAFFSPLELVNLYSKTKLLGTEKIDDRDYYVVEGELPNAGVEKLFFDVNSNLLVRVTSKVTTYLGDLIRQTEIFDYKEVDGVRLPYTIIRKAPDFSSTYRLSEIKNNVSTPEIKFNKPDKPLSSLQNLK